MSDWKVGDLALCVRGGHFNGIKAGSIKEYPQSGALYTVEAVRFFPSSQVLWLMLEGAPDNVDSIGGHNHGPLWNAARCIKITPTEADEFDRETLTLEQPA